MPRKRYDFSFVYNNRNYIIEFDGIQHFEMSPYFYSSDEIFERRRIVDVNKTVAALNQGFFFIRISYNDEDDINDIIDEIINDPNPSCRLVFSDNTMYEWLFGEITKKLTV